MTKELVCKLQDTIKELGANQVDVIPTSSLKFSLEFRSICETNTCGMFKKSWMCPPHVGPAEDLIAEAKTYRAAIVYQTIHPLEDSFDIEGMLTAGEKHNRLARDVQHIVYALTEEPFLQLSAGGCRMCSTCALTEDQPCRFPQEALRSLECYCIDVAQMANACGMNYINGQNTVTFFGALLVH